MAVVHDPASVMLQLATEPAAACILVQPEKLPRLHELTEAIRIYHPETACWRFSFDADHRPRLDELESNGADAQPARAVQDEPPPPPPPPPGKPADAAQRQPAGDGQASLSAEELDMLLAPMSEGTQKETQPSQRN